MLLARCAQHAWAGGSHSARGDTTAHVPPGGHHACNMHTTRTHAQVAEGLYVSGEAVARDRSILAQHRISHVVNCVGALYPEFFKSDGVQYKTLWLQGEAGADGLGSRRGLTAGRGGGALCAAGAHQQQSEARGR
jgi:hypothetical protein